MTVPLFTTFCVLTGVTLCFALYRLVIVRFKADEGLHLMDSEAPLIEKQSVAARRLQTVDAWGKTMTVLAGLAGLATYVAWWLRV